MRLDYPKLCDVHIKTQQNMVYGHSVILATFCEYFKTFFTTELHTCSRNHQGICVVDLSQFSQFSVEMLLHLTYNYQNFCKDDFSELDILEFLVLLDYTGMDSAIKMFVSAIRMNIDNDTWYKWYDFSEKHCLGKLKAIILSFPACEFDEYIKDDKFLFLPYHILEALLNCDLITCYPHDVLKKAIRVWVYASNRDNERYISKLKESFPELTNDIDSFT